MTLERDVFDFMQAVNHTVRSKPSIPTDDEVRLRVRLVLEEAFELAEACAVPGDIERLRGMREAALEAISRNAVDVDMADVADALADIDYVVEGARHTFGINGLPIARAVHEANMKKVLGGKFDEHGKFVKPADWTPPDIRQCLLDQGWDDSQAES